MNNIDPFLSKGSSFYYSLLKTHGKKRQALIALQAFNKKIQKISETTSQANIAMLKLKWWDEEIKKLKSSEKANHPISQELKNIDPAFDISEQALLAIIEGAKLSIQIQLYETQNDLAHHYQHTGGIIELLKAKVLNKGKVEPELERYAHLLGICLETVRHIQYFYSFLSREHLYLPLNSIEKHGLSLEAIYTATSPVNLTDLLQEQAEFARNCYTEALSILPANLFKAQRPGRLYAYLKLKQLDEIAKDQFQVHRHLIKLSALRKLFISLRFR